jgi:peptidyl-prolyl cis-trans isomerase SurA
MKLNLLIVMVLSVILVSGCSTPETDTTQNEKTSLPEGNGMPDLPTGDDVSASAVVNGEEISSDEVAELQQALAAQGQQVSAKEALEELISQQVLLQKVRDEGLTVSTEEVETYIEEQLASQGATLEDYKQQVESQGMSYEDQIESMKEQLAMQEYLENRLGNQSFEVTQEEAQTFYERYKAESTGDVPPYEEIESQIIATLQQQKQQQAMSQIVEELKESAAIEYR